MIAVVPYDAAWPSMYAAERDRLAAALGAAVVRIDHILVRGVKPDSSWSLPATGSDHLPVAAGISW